MQICKKTAASLLQMLQAKEVSAVEVVGAFIDRIQEHDQSIGAYISVMREDALALAKSIDDRRTKGESVGSLAGVPVAVKDIITVADQPTTCGSKMLADFKPPYNATLVQRLQAADAIVIGKTNLDEFAMGGSTENSAIQSTANPWDTTRTPGGSSGGAAAAVAADFAPLSIGTDTGGSIRQPASFCGVVGMKPTYGRVSRYGLIAFASSLDQAGPLTRTAEDAALLLSAIAGHDPRDATSINQPTEDYAACLAKPLEGLRIGVVQEHFGAGLDSESGKAVQAAIDVYQNLGAKVKDVTLPHAKFGIATYYIIAPSEASSNLARYDGAHYGFRAELRNENDEDGPLVRMYRDTRSQGFGDEIKRRIMLGTYALSRGYYDKYYVKALKVRRLIRNDYDAAFEEVDLIAGPVTPTPAFPLGDKVNDPLAMYLGDLFTVNANLAGIPAVSVPCGFTSNGLPIGLHLQGPLLAEERLLRAAHLYQQQTDWHTKRPSL